ncbi:MAG: NAD(P)H-hydrate dehydratase [bacterium]|nr:NAD(P)H-hydrate dehydratase [bacterium]
MKVATVSQMYEIDKITSEKYSIPSLTLMENAGIKSLEYLHKLFSNLKFKKIAIFVGPGNNGGDGLVLARQLLNQKIPVEVFLMFEEEKAKGIAKTNLDIVKSLNIPLIRINFIDKFHKEKNKIAQADIIIDAILGIGTKGTLSNLFTEVIDYLNFLPKPKVALDIPSGINGDTGEVFGTSIKANYTLTFGLPKAGMFLSPAMNYIGKLVIVDIGFPKALLDNSKIKINYTEEKDVSFLLPKRLKDDHKGKCGKVFLLAGSLGMTGAAALSSQAALLTGSGIVILGIPESLNSILEIKLTEVMTQPLPETPSATLSSKGFPIIMDLISKFQAMALGPGIGRDNETIKLVKELVKKISIHLVIDADGIFALAEEPEILKEVKSPIVITPHMGELAHFLKIKINDVSNNRIHYAQKVAKEYKIVVILKGAHTLIADPSGNIFINSTGNPGMASGGVGDVLTGIIAGLLAQGLGILEASKLGVYLHGLAGDLALEEKGELSLIASDLLNNIPKAINYLFSKE